MVETNNPEFQMALREQNEKLLSELNDLNKSYQTNKLHLKIIKLLKYIIII